MSFSFDKPSFEREIFLYIKDFLGASDMMLWEWLHRIKAVVYGSMHQRRQKAPIGVRWRFLLPSYIFKSSSFPNLVSTKICYSLLLAYLQSIFFSSYFALFFYLRKVRKMSVKLKSPANNLIALKKDFKTVPFSKSNNWSQILTLRNKKKSPRASVQSHFNVLLFCGRGRKHFPIFFCLKKGKNAFFNRKERTAHIFQ